MSYVTEAELEGYLSMNIGSNLTAYIATLISASSEYVELVCGNERVSGIKRRRFKNNPVDETKYYDGNGATRLPIDDLREVTSLSVDGVALTENEDYFLYPLNEDVKEWVELIQPYTRIANSNSRIGQGSPYIFEKAQKNVELTGKFGYSENAPDIIKLSVMRIAGGIIKEAVGDSGVKELTQESLGEYSVSFAKISEVANRIGIPEMLATYVRGSISPNAGNRLL